MERKVFENARARFDYDILETFEAGIVLTGHEAKSVRMGRASIAGAHAVVRGGELSIVGLDIPSFQPGNAPESYDAGRTRTLLLSKGEITRLAGKLNEGLTLVPLKLYSAKRFLKIELGLARGKKKYDKRETIKKRETEREIRRSGRD